MKNIHKAQKHNFGKPAHRKRIKKIKVRSYETQTRNDEKKTREKRKR